MTQTSPTAPDEPHLQRNLTNRHIQLIAIGGAIGTGLFMGSGKTISLAQSIDALMNMDRFDTAGVTVVTEF